VFGRYILEFYAEQLLVSPYAKHDGLNISGQCRKKRCRMSILKRYWSPVNILPNILANVAASSRSRDPEGNRKFLNLLN
jgi:hypothetical protein